MAVPSNCGVNRIAVQESRNLNHSPSSSIERKVVLVVSSVLRIKDRTAVKWVRVGQIWHARASRPF